MQRRLTRCPPKGAQRPPPPGPSCDAVDIKLAPVDSFALGFRMLRTSLNPHSGIPVVEAGAAARTIAHQGMGAALPPPRGGPRGWLAVRLWVLKAQLMRGGRKRP